MVSTTFFRDDYCFTSTNISGRREQIMQEIIVFYNVDKFLLTYNIDPIA